LGPSYFGAEDQWQFIASNMSNMCPDCGSIDLDYYWGNELRGLFPYLDVVDLNTIYAHVHPNCRCVLARIGNVQEPDEPQQEPPKELPMQIAQYVPEGQTWKQALQNENLPETEYIDLVDGLYSFGYIVAAVANLLKKRRKNVEENKQDGN